ncbi:protein transport protein bos1 [Nowakowskiella sp. JEL0407]|nr:protein transport protein bos1 [Nowakowskiella sp. JEL0407]
MSSAILHNQAQKQIHQLHLDLQKLESGSDTSSALQGQITATLASVKRAAEDLEEWGKRETSAVKREKALDRAFKLNQDYVALRDRFERHKARVSSSMQAMKDREELLGRRTGTNVKHAEQDTVLLMDQILREHESLNNTNSRLDEYILMGRQALSELVEQRGMLKVCIPNLQRMMTNENNPPCGIGDAETNVGYCKLIGTLNLGHSVYRTTNNH